MTTHLYKAICFFLSQIPAGYAIEGFIQNRAALSHNAVVFASFVINLLYISYTIYSATVYVISKSSAFSPLYRATDDMALNYLTFYFRRQLCTE